MVFRLVAICICPLSTNSEENLEKSCLRCDSGQSWNADQKTYLYLTELFQKIKQDFPLTYRITNFLIVTEVENAKLVFKIISYWDIEIADVVLKIIKDYKFQRSQTGLNCKPLAFSSCYLPTRVSHRCWEH